VTDVQFSSVSPVIPVRDLDAALDRYRRLGFDTRPYTGPDRYGYADRGGVSLHLSEWEDGHDPFPSWTSVYLHVDDADALHAQWRSAGVEGRLTMPHDTPYRLREFAYVDPDGTVVRVGSPLAGAADA
jgi:catechol 2,3-dioxygenase-like lactoylglutathione lyase family enzyme